MTEKTMDIGVEISLYPLRNDYIPPIRSSSSG